MSHEDVLVDIDEVDNVGVRAGAPVKVNLATRFGNITKNLQEKKNTLIVT